MEHTDKLLIRKLSNRIKALISNRDYNHLAMALYIIASMYSNHQKILELLVDKTKKIVDPRVVEQRAILIEKLRKLSQGA